MLADFYTTVLSILNNTSFHILSDNEQDLLIVGLVSDFFVAYLLIF